jgi:hypothetical protein
MARRKERHLDDIYLDCVFVVLLFAGEAFLNKRRWFARFFDSNESNLVFYGTFNPELS